jgi:hypothetical protein
VPRLVVADLRRDAFEVVGLERLDGTEVCADERRLERLTGPADAPCRAEGPSRELELQAFRRRPAEDVCERLVVVLLVLEGSGKVCRLCALQLPGANRPRVEVDREQLGRSCELRDVGVAGTLPNAGPLVSASTESPATSASPPFAPREKKSARVVSIVVCLLGRVPANTTDSAPPRNRFTPEISARRGVSSSPCLPLRLPSRPLAP